MTAPLEGKDKTTEFHQLDLPDVEPNGYTKGKSIFQNNDEASDMSNSPLQKRQRVARACDECRRRKIKCNGKQPCIHCQVYTYDCAYGKPPNRYRDSAPQYVETLERRLQRAEALLKKSMPDVNIADLKLDRAIKQELRLQVQVREKGLKKEDNSSLSPVEPDEHFESTISGVGQLEFDSSGEYYFQGPSSSEVFFKMIKNHLKGWLGHDYHVPVISSLTKYSNIVGLEPPRLSAIGSRSRSNSKRFKADICDLPPEATAYQLCSHSLEYATGLLQIVHVPSFYTMVDKIYAKPPEKYGSWETGEDKDLALLYSVLALGCMYSVSEDEKSKKPPYEIALEQGLKYYTSSRLLLRDLTDCQDLTSLQTLLYLVLFLQEICNIGTCYSILGIALRSALRMGLHRNLPHNQGTAIEAELRRRVFSVCRQLDIYISAIHGFPILLNEDDIDQPLPTPIDDEYITQNGMLSMPLGTTSLIEAFNAHARLMEILSKIIKHVYPVKGNEQRIVMGSQIRELEIALQEWTEELPVAWRLDSDGSEEIIHTRNLLRSAYAQVQMILYRPFFHTFLKIKPDKVPDVRSYACGAACVDVARDIIQIGIGMRKHLPLVGPCCFTLFTEYYAIVMLIFYVLGNEDKPGIADIRTDVMVGRNMVNKLARRSLAADRISKALDVMLHQLPIKINKVTANAVPSRMRSVPGPNEFCPAVTSPSLMCITTEKIDGMQNRSVHKARGSLGPMVPNFSFDLDTSFRADDIFPTVTDMPPVNLLSAPVDSRSLGQMEQGRHLPKNMGHEVSPIHQVDAVMFRLVDPVALPSQPDFTLSGKSQPHDPSQFYTPTILDGIEGQLTSLLPCYLMPTPNGQSEFSHPGASTPTTLWSLWDD